MKMIYAQWLPIFFAYFEYAGEHFRSDRRLDSNRRPRQPRSTITRSLDRLCLNTALDIGSIERAKCKQNKEHRNDVRGRPTVKVMKTLTQGNAVIRN